MLESPYVERAEWLEMWGYVDGTPEAEEAWKNKVELDNRIAGIGNVIRGNDGIIPDIQPYQSMIDGSYIGSRSRHRTHLRDHGCVEVGNETKYVTTPPPPKRVDWKPEIVRQIQQEKERQRRKA